jgi:hypothetical protein
VHVVARNRNRVELRQLAAGVLDHVGANTQRRRRWINIGISDEKFLQNVVLHRAAEHPRGQALLFGRDQIAGQHGQHGAVHGHGDADVAQRNAVEQALHVLDGVDGDTGLAYVTARASVGAVVTPMGGKVEGDAQPFLSAKKRLLVEGVRFLGRRKARVLADGPRPARVHAGPQAARIRILTWQRALLGQVSGVFGVVDQFAGHSRGRPTGKVGRRLAGLGLNLGFKTRFGIGRHDA